MPANTPPAAPAIPNRTFNIAEQGVRGDGKTLSTTAIQKAIDQASAAGGGMVLIPAGTFVCGPIKLKSNIDLHLAKGATLQMSSNFDDFPINGKDHESFIAAADAHDIQISGEGVIDGQGQPWWDAFRKDKGASNASACRPQMIRLSKCQRVRLAGFTTQNPPNTRCSMSDCAEITI